jgi:N,N'-diacetyllegionaminate synthase
MKDKIINTKTSCFYSDFNSVFYIAEIGGNHEGNYDYAKKLTQLAIESGADAIKFQFYTGDTLVSSVEDKDRNLHFKKFELSNKQNIDLMRQVSESGAMPMASIWDKEMLSWADPHIPIHKVGSGDLTCYPMLKALVETGKPIILSTGLSSLNEVANAVAYIERCDSLYISEKKLALLQCTSSYPTPDQDANINAMVTLKNEFGLPVGYSDHTLGSDAIEIAVALGAEIIEKHFTDTRKGKVFRDHLIALTSDEVQDSLKRMSKILTLKGDGVKNLTSSEREAGHNISFRRSLYVNRDVKAGDRLTSEDLSVLRPFHGICASRFDENIDRVVRKNISKNHALKEEDLV